MCDQPSILTAPLGHPFTPYQMRRETRYVCGGVSWPTKRPGFGVVLGVPRVTAHPAEPEICVLAEVEAEDLAQLARACDGFDSIYEPQAWYGDDVNSAANQILFEMAQAKQPVHPADEYDTRRALRFICRSSLLELDPLYAYLLPMIKGLLRPEYKRLLLKGSRALDYLAQVKPDEIPDMKRGECPAIEALAYAVREALNCETGPIQWDAYRSDRTPSRPRGAMTC